MYNVSSCTKCLACIENQLHLVGGGNRVCFRLPNPLPFICLWVHLYPVFKGVLNAYVKNELAGVIGPGMWNCAMLMKFVKASSFYLVSMSCFSRLQGILKTAIKSQNFTVAGWPSTQNAQLQRGCIYAFSTDLRFDLECIMFNFSMLQLASERYVWLCIASGEAVTEVHNKRGTWRRFLLEKSGGLGCKPHTGCS